MRRAEPREKTCARCVALVITIAAMAAGCHAGTARPGTSAASSVPHSVAGSRDGAQPKEASGDRTGRSGRRDPTTLDAGSAAGVGTPAVDPTAASWWPQPEDVSGETFRRMVEQHIQAMRAEFERARRRNQARDRPADVTPAGAPVERLGRR
jgi:hypothetical protein